MLDQLAKADKDWRRMALSICGCKELADDIVQDMYLRLYNRTNEITPTYVFRTMVNLFKDHLKKLQHDRLEELNYLEHIETTFEPDDQERELLDKIECLTWLQKELLSEKFDRSLREIESIYNINYGFIYKQIKQAKLTVLYNG